MPRSRRSDSSAVGIVTIALVLALFWVWGRAPRDAPGEPEAPQATAAGPNVTGASPTTPRGERVAALPASPPEPAPRPAKEALPPQIQRFMDANRFPPTSRPLTRDATDRLEPNRRYEKPRPLDEDGELTFVFTADRYFYTGDEVAHVWLDVWRGDQPAPVQLIRATALAERTDGPSLALVDLGLSPAGARWAGGLDLNATFPDHHGTILLEVSFAAAGGEIRDEAIRIFTTPVERIPARFTGDYRDSIHEGSLLVQLGVEVFRPGFFVFDANLFDYEGTPVASSAFKGPLGPGVQFVPLEFFGLLLHDSRAIGPYTIDQIRGYRFLEAQTPDRERLPDESLVIQTSAYDYRMFSDEEYTSEHKERMIQLMLEDIEAGISLDVPPKAPGS